MAVEEPKVSAVLVSQSIEEKLSARNGRKAPNFDDIATVKVSGSSTVTSVIGPQEVLVSEGLSPKARSMVNFTSCAVKSLPS